MEQGSSIVIASLIAGIIATFVINIWPQQQAEINWSAALMVAIAAALSLVGLPLVTYFVMGMPISAEYPVLKGFNFKGGISIIPELAALMLALSIYTAAFIAEIVRSGINAVNHGQTEAAMSLGIPRARTLKLCILFHKH